VSSLAVTARAAADSVPPMRKVGAASTSAANASRSSVAPAEPSVTEPPDAMYSARTPSMRNGVSAAVSAMPHSSAP
jgi:hypothetical protein